MNFQGIYGFFDRLPQEFQEEAETVRLQVDPKSFIVTSEVSDMAKNHCAAVLACNLFLYYKQIDPSYEADWESKRELFTICHEKIGNGPVLFLAEDVEEIGENLGLDVNHYFCVRLEDCWQDLSQGHPIALLLSRNLFDWHWVLAFGMSYLKGRVIFHIFDGWNSRIRYYEKNQGSHWWAGRSYELSPSLGLHLVE